MPRYYFDIASDDNFIQDLEGVELKGEKEAVDEAMDAAREMLAELVLKGEVIDGQRFDVRDANGTRLFTLPFRRVLRFD